MILRRVFDILRAGLTAFAKNPALYDILLTDYLGLDVKEAAGMKAALARAPVRMQMGYPHADIQMPCMALILQAESTSQKFIGDRGFLPLGNNPPGSIGAGGHYEFSAQLLIYSENIDLTSVLFEVACAILICSHDELARQGVMSPSYTGTDLAPDPSKIPENLFVKSLGIRASYALVLSELLEQQLKGTMLSALYLPPGTERSPDYDSGVTVSVPSEP